MRILALFQGNSSDTSIDRRCSIGVGILLVLCSLVFPSLAKADNAIEAFGRLSLGLAGREGRTLSQCQPLQDRQSYYFARRDCNFADLALYFTKDLYQAHDQDDLWVRAHASLLAETQLLRDWADTNQQGDEGLRLTQRSFFVEFGNGLSKQEAIWMGRRRYQTIYFRVLDLYALDSAGPGIGLDNWRLSEQWRLSLAFFRNMSIHSGPVQDTLDLRFKWSNAQNHSLLFAALVSQTGRHNPRGDDLDYVPISGFQALLLHNYETERFDLSTVLQGGGGLFGSEDGRAYGEGPAELFNQFGATRRYTFLQAGIYEAERKALQRSKSLRAAQQFRWLPLEKGLFVEAGWAWQQADFGGLASIDADGQIWSRPNGNTQVVVFQPSYEFTKFHGLELHLSLLRIKNGLANGRFLDSGEQQDGIEAVDREMQRQVISWKWRPLSWGSSELRIFMASQRWNREIAPDLSRRVQDLRTKSYAAGLNFEVWW